MKVILLLFSTFLTPTPRNVGRVLTVNEHESESARVLYNFNCLFEAEGLPKVTGGHVHCKRGNISEMVQDGIIITTDH